KYFYFVVKLGGVTNAAKFLNITQPAVSRKIQGLEDRINCKLFIRTPIGLEITRKGEELFEIIEQTFLSLKGFAYNASISSNFNNGRKRKIRISTTHAIATYILSEPLITYNQMCPEIILEIITEERQIDLAVKDIDIAIRPYQELAKGIEQ